MRIPVVCLLASLVACDDGGSSTPAPDAVPGDASARDADLRDSGPQRAPRIELMPGSVTLVASPDGPSEPAMITVRNRGDGVLEIAEILLEPADDRFSLDGVPSLPATVPPDASITFTVQYSGADRDPVRVGLTIRSNDPERSSSTVQVTGRLLQNCLRVSPAMVNLGTVQPGQQSGRFGVNLSNCGDVEIDVTDVRVEGDPNFNWTAPQGRNAVGPLGASAVLSLDIWYENLALAPQELARGTLVIESDAAENPRVEIELQARGDDILGCVPRFRPDRLEFDMVRIGTERTMDLTIVNQGSGACEVRNVSIEKSNGPAENLFAVTDGLEGLMVPPQSETTLQVTFAPIIDDPIGDRGSLFFDYRDPHLMENRRLAAQLLGVGAPALIGGVPDQVVFADTTAPDCASPERSTEATNVGFVPLCVTGFRLDGDNCSQFALLEVPDFEECIPLMPDEGVPFRFAFQPDSLGIKGCLLVVSSDAMNIAELGIPLRGEGVEGPESSDRFEVGRLNPMRRAFFSLSRPAVADSIMVTVDDEPNEDWGYERGLNDIFFERADHPDEGAIIEVEYLAECLERQPGQQP